jgi:hypothetical protein
VYHNGSSGELPPSPRKPRSTWRCWSAAALFDLHRKRSEAAMPAPTLPPADDRAATPSAARRAVPPAGPPGRPAAVRHAMQRRAPGSVLLAVLLALAVQIGWRGQPPAGARGRRTCRRRRRWRRCGWPRWAIRWPCPRPPCCTCRASTNKPASALPGAISTTPRSAPGCSACSTSTRAASTRCWPPAKCTAPSATRRARARCWTSSTPTTEDPDHRWPWLAHAALAAKHRLHDLPRARRYAEAIRLHATGAGVPAWARELEIFIAEDMNERDAARALIGGLLRSGQITDPHELQFLADRLDQLDRLKQP